MSAAEPIYIPRKIWTRAEVDSRSWDGLSLELIEGDLIDRMGKKPPHIFWKTALRVKLARLFGDEYLQIEDPIDVAPQDNPTSEPEPDIAVSFQPFLQTRGQNLKPSDLRLVVEISDSTYDLDSKVKAALYARAGIREYWLIDIRQEHAPRWLRHLDPKNGQYTVTVHGFEDSVSIDRNQTLRLRDLTQ